MALNIDRKSANWVIRNTLELECAKGNVAGCDHFQGFGERDNVQIGAFGEDLWQGTATWIPTPDQLGGEQIAFKSNNHDDRVGGTGIPVIHYHYLDAIGDVQAGTVTLDGTVTVFTDGTNIRFIQQLQGLYVGPGNAASGDLIAYQRGTEATVYSKIQAGGNNSLSTLRMVPRAKTLYISAFNGSATGKKRVVIRLRATTHEGLLTGTTFLFKDSANLEDAAFHRDFHVPIKAPALSQVKISAWTDLAGAYVSASYEGMLIDD